MVRYLMAFFFGFLFPRLWSHNQRPFIYNPSETLDKQDLLLIGIMTNNQLIHERGCAIKNTWGKHFRNIVFYLEETPLSQKPNCDIGTIVHLRGVSNTYPPQKKSFMMFRHMASYYGGRYKWFLRADDDVYVNFDNLRTFLASIRSIDDDGSHILHYIGQVIGALDKFLL